MGPPVAELKSLFKRKGMSQRAVAERAGVSQQAISRWLTGRDTPTGANQRRLAASLGISPRELREVTGWPANEDPAAMNATRRAIPFEPLTSFVGREEFVARLRESLAREGDGPRLIVLTGFPGVGKTRIARRVAALLTPDYEPGHVRFVTFQPPPDAPGDQAPEATTRVAQAVGEALGVEPAPDQSWLDVLLTRRPGQARLLVLDGFEQVIAAADELHRIVAANPDLRVLVTSRNRLHRDGALRTVPPMDVPTLPDAIARLTSPGERANRIATLVDGDDGAGLLANESVRLFIDRARLVWPDFALTRDNAAAVVSIVERLQGLPLAIEAVAARGRFFGGPGELLEHLKQSASLPGAKELAAGSASDLVHAAIRGSHDLLTPEQRVVFRRLAVLAGGFSITMAIEMLARYEAPPEDPDAPIAPVVLDPVFASAAQEHVFHLIDASLIGVEATPDGSSRCRMPEPVRELGLARLHEAGELEGLQRVHARAYLALAVRAGSQFGGPDQRFWLDLIAGELDNFRAALAWAQANDLDAMGQSLPAALWWFWEIRGHYEEGREWLQRALNAPKPGRRYPWVVLGAGVMALRRGDLDQAGALLGRATRQFEAARDHAGEMYAVSYLGVAADIRGHDDEAIALFGRGLELARELRDWYIVAGSLGNLGEVHLRLGDLARANELFVESSTLSRARGMAYTAARAQNNLGRVALRAGDQARAVVYFREGLQFSHGLGDARGVAFALESIAAAVAPDDPAHAARVFGAAAGLREALSAPLQADYGPDQQAGEAIARGLLGDAAYEAEWSRGQAETLARVVAAELEPRPTDAHASTTGSA